MSGTNQDDPRYTLRKKYDAQGKINQHSESLHTLEIDQSGPGKFVMGTLGAGKLLTIAMRKDFFQPNTPGMEPIRAPEDYLLTEAVHQTNFSKDDKLQLWISEPKDKAKGYVVYFEGMAGHFGDLGIPSLVTQHNKLARKRGAKETLDGTAETRNYRLERINALQEHGYGVIAVHLPGFGASKGTPTEENFQKAINEALIPWLTTGSNKIDLDNLTIMGASQGAASATYMAKRLSEQGRPPKLLTLVAPPLSTADCVVDAETAPDGLKGLLVRNQHDVIMDGFTIAPMLAEVSTDTKVLVMGGGKDWVVPDHHVKMVAAAAQKTQHETREVFEPAAEHTTINPDLIASNIDAFLKGQSVPEQSPIALAKGAFSYTAAMHNSRKSAATLQV